jgi:hypothetical protein
MELGRVARRRAREVGLRRFAVERQGDAHREPGGVVRRQRFRRRQIAERDRMRGSLQPSDGLRLIPVPDRPIDLRAVGAEHEHRRVAAHRVAVLRVEARRIVGIDLREHERREHVGVIGVVEDLHREQVAGRTPDGADEEDERASRPARAPRPRRPCAARTRSLVGNSRGSRADASPSGSALANDVSTIRHVVPPPRNEKVSAPITWSSGRSTSRPFASAAPGTSNETFRSADCTHPLTGAFAFTCSPSASTVMRPLPFP